MVQSRSTLGEGRIGMWLGGIWGRTTGTVGDRGLGLSYWVLPARLRALVAEKSWEVGNGGSMERVLREGAEVRNLSSLGLSS